MRTFTSAHVQGVQGAHSGSKYCVYQHNESSERETEREREGGREEGEEKAIFPTLFFSPLSVPPPPPPPPPHTHFPPVVPLPSFPVFCLLPLFAQPDQRAAASFSATLAPSAGLRRCKLVWTPGALFGAPRVLVAASATASDVECRMYNSLRNLNF